MKSRSLNEQLEIGNLSEVINIDFDTETLVVTISVDNYRFDIAFYSTLGFRVLDEGDLLEFWPHCSTTNGWLFEIESGGWFDQESQRKGFLSMENGEVQEFFIAGENYCVNVLAFEKPDVTESIR